MSKDILKKFTSRKFIVTAISIIAGVISLIIGENKAVEIISSAAMVVVPAIVYCFMEGRIDAASVKNITGAVADAAEQLGAAEGIVDTIEDVGKAGEALLDEDPSGGET